MKVRFICALLPIAMLAPFTSHLLHQHTSKNAVITIEVTDPSGAAIPNARIEIAATGIVDGGAMTDAAGKVQFEWIPGDFDLTVSEQGFRTVKRQINVRPGENQKFQIVLDVMSCPQGPCMDVIPAAPQPVTIDQGQSETKTPQSVPAPKPSSSVVINMPQVVKPESETLLEIATTNISDDDLPIRMICGWPSWALAYKIDVHDAAGHPVPLSSVGHGLFQGPMAWSCSGAIQLKPGEIRREQVLLNRLFDLRQPGEYTVQVQSKYPSNAVHSNTVTFQVPSAVPSIQPGKPSFSISITTPFDAIKTGWEIPLEISVKNISDQEIKLATWDARDENEPRARAGEFGSGVDVRDAKGNLAPPGKQGQTFLNGDGYPDGDFAFVSIPPGESLEKVRAIGYIYNFSHPGTYSIQVVLADPATHVPVRSNILNVTVSDSAPFHPPFIVAIDPERTSAGYRQYDLRICQSNISDDSIKLDSRPFNDEFSIRDSQGAEPPLNKEGRRVEQFYEPLIKLRGLYDGVDVPPGGVRCDYKNLSDYWDVSHPGKYSIQITRPDYPDKVPGQKNEDLPTVKSNTVIWMAPGHSQVVAK
jgi:Carboxypeptidase regulatory-like domain